MHPEFFSVSSWGFAHLNENCRNKIEYQPKIIVGNGEKKKTKWRKKNEPETTIACLGAGYPTVPGCVVFVFFFIVHPVNFLHLVPALLGVGWGEVGWGFFFLISLLNWIKKATVINAQGGRRRRTHSRREGPGAVHGVLPKSNAKSCLLHMWQRLPRTRARPRPRPALPCPAVVHPKCRATFHILGKSWPPPKRNAATDS